MKFKFNQLKIIRLLPLIAIGLGSTSLQAETDWGLVNRFYDINQVIKIDIELPEWDLLRNAKPKGGVCTSYLLGPRYDWYVAPSITINNVAFKPAAIKKRNWCGSVWDIKPGLGIDLDKIDPNNKALADSTLGVTKIILNNSKQDPTLVRQCLAYHILAKAGVKGPMCNFAKVTVNGMDQGVYINIQHYNEPSLDNSFGTNYTNMYELAWSWFSDKDLPKLQYGRDYFQGADDSSEIESLIADFEASRGKLTNQLLNRIDLSEIIRFWALEIILNHWDGLANNNNNSFVLFDQQGKVHFLPWGTDSVLQESKSKINNNFEKNSFMAALATDINIRTRVNQEVANTMATVWNADELTNYIKTMVDKIRPLLKNGTDLGNFDKQVDILKSIVISRPKDLKNFTLVKPN